MSAQPEHTEHNVEYVPVWAVELNAKMDTILAVHEKILETVEELKPEVMAVVNGLQSNPMLKMFLGKGK